MGANDVRLNYIAEVGKALSDMGAVKTATTAQIKETQRATAALAAYDKAQAAVSTTASKVVVPSMDGATKSAAKMTQAQQQLKQVTSNLGYQIGDVANSIAAGQAPMAAFGRQVLDVAFQFNTATLASAAFKAASSPATLGLVALGTAALVVANQTFDARQEIDKYTSAVEKAGTATASLAKSNNALKLATGDVAGFIGDLQIQTALLHGEISQSDIDAGRMAATLADKLAPNLNNARAAVLENERAIIDLNAATKSGKLNAEELAAAHIKLSRATGAKAGLAGNLAAVEREAQAAREAISAYSLAVDAAAKSAPEEKKATANDDAAAAARALMDEEEFYASVRAEIGEIDAKRREDANKAAWAAAEDEVTRGDKLTATALADIDRIEKAQKASNARAADYADEQARIIGDVFAVGIEGAAFLSEEVAKRGIGTGKVLFAVSKGLAIADAVINTHRAANLALATIPPPLGYVAAGVALASGAIQVGKIAATEPQFHRGRASDEMPATILRSERVLTATGARAMGGDRAVAAANRGQSTGGTVTAAFVLGHRVYDKQTKTALSVPGSSLAAALTRGQHVGHR